MILCLLLAENPSVVIIDTKTGEVVSVNGYGGINRDPMGKVRKEVLKLKLWLTVRNVLWILISCLITCKCMFQWPG